MLVPNSQVGITLYNFRESCRDEAGLDATLGKLREIGYRSVQLSGVSLEPQLVKKLLDRHNLYCCATHEGIGMLEDVDAFLKKMAILECDFGALGSPPREYRDQAGWNRLIELFNQAGQKAIASGVRIGYHNHHFEFRRFTPGAPIWLEQFYDQTNRECVFAEIDVYWIARGGQDPVKWINRLAGRMPVIHFKDFMINSDDQACYCEVGEGNLDWPAIIDACNRTGVRFMVVEQDEPNEHDPLESAAISFANLAKLGVN